MGKNGVIRAPQAILHALTTILIFTLITLSACSQQQEIKIGYAGGLTGRVAELGVAGRDGVTLAIEQANAAGGIHGRKLQLLVEDDQQDSTVAREAVSRLLGDDVVAIIGHMTSSMSMATLDIINESDVIMISPTTSSSELNGIDDQFLRVYPSVTYMATSLAEMAINDLGCTRVAIVYDVRNRSYTECFKNSFTGRFTRDTGQVCAELPFESGPGTGFLPIAEELAEGNPDSILILANSIDTAMICQQLSKLGATSHVLVSDWSTTEDLIEHGGASVEGVQFMSIFNRNSHADGYREFQQAFNTRFGHSPGFAATHSYDCAQMLFRALKSSLESGKPLKQSLLDLGPVEGLQTRIHLDTFGDVERQLFPIIIENGQFQPRE